MTLNGRGQGGVWIVFLSEVTPFKDNVSNQKFIVANCSHYIICYLHLDMLEFFALLSESVCAL